MGEASTTFRLVRCPKCENLLPELPEFSVYQCGGCGAVLRGTGKANPPTSDDSGVESSEKVGPNIEGGSVIEKKNENLDLQRTKESVIHEKTANINIKSSPRTETMEISIDSDRNMRRRSDHYKSEVDYNSYREKRLSNMNVSNEPSEPRSQLGSLRSRPVMDQWSPGRNDSSSFHGKGRDVDVGPSSYHVGPFNGYDGLSRVKDLENDRAELLRKLDVLKDQLKRTCDITENPKERLDPHSVTNTIHREPPYFDHYHGGVPYANNHPLERQYYPSLRDVPNDYSWYRGTYHPHVIGRPSHQPPHQYLPPTYNNHFQEPNMAYYGDPLVSHTQYFHQPSCSCLRCYSIDRQKQNPPNVLSPVSNSRDYMYPTFDRHRDPITYSRISRERSHMRSSSDFPTENVGGFGLHNPRRIIIARGGGRVCHPIAGGAPFVSCCNCFELLKISRKFMMLGKNQRKMKCGACSAVIMFEFENKNLTVSVPAPSKRIRTDVGVGSGETSSKSLLSSGYEFHLTDSEPNQSLNDQQSTEAEKGQELSFSSSSSSSISGDEESPESVINRREDSEFCEIPSENNGPLNDSETLDNRNGKGNRSKRNDLEKVTTERTIARQSSLQDASVATEMDVPLNEYINNGVDPIDMSKEEDRVKNKGSESFFAGLIKKSLRDFSRSSKSTENRRPNVFVNGQPIPDRVVKKAEKLAGPIQPGEYWYDFQAGFWGVMNQPCLGVIPPFIEEFNYPLPENCAAGNTGVFVNGRELHQRDLDLLAGRGLPTTRDRSYIVEISGRVIDEDTCEELDCLGKLAPTVEREKRGFGMRVPRATAE